MKTKGEKTTIGVLGYGNMGRAIVAQLRTIPAFRAKSAIAVYSRKMGDVRAVQIATSSAQLAGMSRVLFLCIKPQDFYQLKPFSRQETQHLTVISIMAGVSISNIRRIFTGARVVRTMPNLPLQVGQGVIGWYYEQGDVDSKARTLLDNIFSAFGLSVAVTDERKLDALTAVAGSGPAYVFLFANALMKSAESLGFDKATARRIVLQTIQGSLAFATSQKEVDFDRLIEKVKSKGGTTEVALHTLGVERFYMQWEQAIKQACQRAEEISSYEPR